MSFTINLGDFQYFSNIIAIFHSSPSEVRIVLTLILLEVMVYWLDSDLRAVSVSLSADGFICGGFSWLAYLMCLILLVVSMPRNLLDAL